MARLVRFGPKLVKKNEEKGPKYEILKNLAENWSLEPKLDRKWAKKEATMAKNFGENFFLVKIWPNMAQHRDKIQI